MKTIQKAITKEEFKHYIKGLSKEFEVIGPRELPGKGILYQYIVNVDDLYLGGSFTTEPIKKFFLEPSLCILKHQQKDSKFDTETIQQSNKQRILIGARPCEVRGLILLDKVFDPSTGSGSTLNGVERVDSDYKDNFYINNRKRTIIVGMACSKPDRSCFCTSMGGSPIENVDMDVLMIEADNRVFVEIITSKGEEIFSSLGKDIDENQKKLLELNKEKIEDLVETKIKIPENLDKSFESDYWNAASASCISCGICTYLCPTCHCFDLVDEERKRLRCYDGCSFPDFTLQASGENPRPTKRERYRQRVFHKFDYFKKNFGENLCVGCSRCIRYCPVKIDISEVVDKASLPRNK